MNNFTSSISSHTFGWLNLSAVFKMPITSPSGGSEEATIQQAAAGARPGAAVQAKL